MLASLTVWIFAPKSGNFQKKTGKQVSKALKCHSPKNCLYLTSFYAIAMPWKENCIYPKCIQFMHPFDWQPIPKVYSLKIWDFYLKYKSLSSKAAKLPSSSAALALCCPGIAHSPFLSWVLLLLRLSDQAQIWLPLAMINDFSYPQRLRS